MRDKTGRFTLLSLLLGCGGGEATTPADEETTVSATADSTPSSTGATEATTNAGDGDGGDGDVGDGDASGPTSDTTSDEEGTTGDGDGCPEGDPGCPCGDVEVCQPPATCDPSNPDDPCPCPAGFERFPGDDRCYDIDECEDEPTICGALDCANHVGSYSCHCPAGTVDQGGSCVQASACTVLADFDDGSAGPNWLEPGKFTATAGGSRISSEAAHDGGFGISQGQWVVSTGLTVGAPGSRVSAWVRWWDPDTPHLFRFGGDGEYAIGAGFAANQSSMNLGVASSQATVVGENDTRLRAPRQLRHWYKLEFEFKGTSVELMLYDSDGTSLLGAATHDHGGEFVPGMMEFNPDFDGTEGLQTGLDNMFHGGRDIDTIMSCAAP